MWLLEIIRSKLFVGLIKSPEDVINLTKGRSLSTPELWFKLSFDSNWKHPFEVCNMPHTACNWDDWNMVEVTQVFLQWQPCIFLWVYSAVCTYPCECHAWAGEGHVGSYKRCGQANVCSQYLASDFEPKCLAISCWWCRWWFLWCTYQVRHCKKYMVKMTTSAWLITADSLNR